MTSVKIMMAHLQHSQHRPSLPPGGTATFAVMFVISVAPTFRTARSLKPQSCLNVKCDSKLTVKNARRLKNPSNLTETIYHIENQHLVITCFF